MPKENRYKRRGYHQKKHEIEEQITCPAPSLAIIMSGCLGAIGSLENSGNELWLQRNDVYVFGFEFEVDVCVEFSADRGNSLPFGSHFSSSDFTDISKHHHRQYLIHKQSRKCK